VRFDDWKWLFQRRLLLFCSWFGVELVLDVVIVLACRRKEEVDENDETRRVFESVCENGCLVLSQSINQSINQLINVCIKTTRVDFFC